MATNTNTNKDSRTGKESAYQPGETYSPWDDNAGTLYHPDNGRDHEGNLDNGAGYNEKSDATQQAVDNLRDAEHSAVSRQEPSYPPTASTSEGKSYYTGNGGKSQATPKKGKGKFKKGGLGAVLTILLVFAGIGTFLGTSNSLLAPAMSALMTTATQTSFTSYTLRTKFITSGMLENAGGGAVTRGWTGKIKYSKIPNHLKSRLALQGIEVHNDSGGKTSLSWTRTLANGSTDTVDGITADQFIKMYNDNPEFRQAYTRAKRGRVATFFDNIANKLYQKLGISRNLFNNYKQSNDYDTDVGNYKETMEPKFEGSNSRLQTKSEDVDEPIYARDDDGHFLLDADDNPIIEGYEPSNKIDGNSQPATTGSETSIDAAKPKASAFIADVAKTVGDAGTWVCTALKVGNMIAITAAAQEIYQSINYFMGQMENVSKMKAGYGDQSAINSFLNFMSTPATTTTTSDFGKLGVVTVAEGSEPTIEQKEETGSPLEATGMQVMLAGAKAQASDTANYSLERIIKSLGGVAAFGVGATAACAGVGIANSIMALGVSLSGGLVTVVGSFFLKFAINLATTVAVTAFLSFLVPTIAKIFFTNAFDIAEGIPAGQLLAQGGAAANMREGRSGSGQSPSSEAAALAFNHSTNTVLAMEAEEDRLTYSPFDATNRNTFFGSIAYSLLPVTTSKNMTGLAAFLRTTSKSLSSLVGKASAAGKGESYLTTFGDCPLLESIGAVGDLYCNPIVTTDMQTEMIELSPDDSRFQDVLMSTGDGASNPNLANCDAEGNCEIQNNSNLARYIAYCDNRDSPFGVVDQNILGAMQNPVTSNSFLNAIPIVGDVFDILNNASDLNHIAWANGSKCGNTADNATFWKNEGRYYQRYVEDQRILEQMGAYEGSTNPVTAFEEKYEAAQKEKYKNYDPIVAYYSRISGLTPENTETTLAFVYYYNFVDQYDPTVRIAMEGETSKLDETASVIAKAQSEHIHINSSEYIDTPILTHTPKYAIYADIRNRSYAIC